MRDAPLPVWRLPVDVVADLKAAARVGERGSPERLEAINRAYARAETRHPHLFKKEDLIK